MFEEHQLIRRAAVQCFTNLCTSPLQVARCEGKNDKVKYVVLLCGDDEDAEVSGWELWKARRFSSTLARRWRDPSQTLACWCGNMSRGNNLERWSCAGYSSWLSCWYGIMPGGNNPERWNRTGTADYKRESMKRKRALVGFGRWLDSDSLFCLDTHHRI